jgi:hypothetical protein
VLGLTAVTLRVPFTKNGGGLHVNTYTVTMMIKQAESGRSRRCILGTTDKPTTQVAKPGRIAAGELWLTVTGMLQWNGSVAISGAPPIKPQKWVVISFVVDAAAGSIKAYVNGSLVAESDNDKDGGDMKDSCYALRGKHGGSLVMFPHSTVHTSDWKLRSCCVHSRCLTGEQVSIQHVHSVPIARPQRVICSATAPILLS